MNDIIKLSTVILFVLGLCSCFDLAHKATPEKLTWVVNSDPVLDAEQAIEQKDLRFIAVHNHHLKMPLNINSCWVTMVGYRTLSNEAFEYGSYDYQRFGALAQLYANWYNNRILLYLQDNTKTECEAN